MNVVFDEMIDGFRFTGMADKEIGEEATEVSPSWPTFYTVFTLHIDGSHKDCLEIINPAIVQRIEKMLAEDV
ncbi:hypothetical protein UFOVP626_49 [uncultured Caudovirales phage]|uniref:Uncharacterized protein n=1 Tax=uncultured Caudovirales phage TaxID=2100421 RepID=A0A6J5S722_9CAUD|nr:hypothetical protein UFOVP626_49 [uncultured Caudovirales phage]CAB4173295.1 hypothetical protein UFOVP951_44 [uncultured Caudovirales phage]CAB4184881.1 hypothetical protein UFOVP1115_47 [uncultured Caudovirales phage]CAB4204331.1 hypothetical protein UFOVP1390_55 [uncultured Caudovirales phage]CAB5238461.1 hypothetical protein UFOVP1567_46 [uncultured Caudovirales phage]